MEVKYISGELSAQQLWNLEPAVEAGTTVGVKRGYPGINLQPSYIYSTHDSSIESIPNLIEISIAASALRHRKSQDLCLM